MIQTLEVVFENEDLIAINKPHGLLVHKSRIATDATEFALQILRNQINRHVYPVHRLDRKTSGVLLFAKSKEVNSATQRLFSEREVKKTYIALVRGFITSEGSIDYNLTENGKTQNAITDFKLLHHFEIPLAFGKYPTSRYSLIELYPLTGRFHQLRKHTAHIFHPIIGDRPHGCNKQNKLWKEQYNMTTMLLHAQSLQLTLENKTIHIDAKMSTEFERVLQLLKNKNLLSNTDKVDPV